MPTLRDTAVADVPVMILAGGLATRMRPITETIPKALIDVAGEPFIDHQLRLLHEQGVRRVVMCVGHLGEMVVAHAGDGRRHGLSIDYSFDGPKLLGTGGALRQAASLVGDELFILYGDSYLICDYRSVLDSFRRQGKLALMTVLRNENRWDRSNVIFDRGRLVTYDKRKQTPEMRHVDYGLTVMRKSALLRIPEQTAYDLADLCHELSQEGELAGQEVFDRFYECGSPSGLAELTEHIRRRGAA